MSAEQTVRIDSSAANPVFTQSPVALTGMVYTTLIENVPTVNTANNYLSVFNPIGSGKNLIFAQFTAFPYATAAQATTINMEVQRISTATGGTQLAAANINKFDTTQANATAEVRTGNPTVTLVGTVPLIAIPPAITNAANGVSSPVDIIPPTGSLFICRPGEGVVVKQLAGAGTTQVWSLGLTWSEI
jgi:hypothetical protein